MLIPSPRHRPADLRLWAELEIADRLNGERLEREGRKVERSIEAIRAFAAEGPCYASTSWGKDSVVALHLTERAGVDVQVWNLDVVPSRNPHCDDVRDAYLAERALDYHEEAVNYADLDRLMPRADWNRLTDERWFGAIARVGAKVGTRRVIMGLRADESGGRARRCRVWGENSPASCCPLAWWTARDVFGYLAHHRLPVHPNYAMLGGGRWKRERLRVAELGDTHGDGMGRAEWEREYYGSELRRLEAGR